MTVLPTKLFTKGSMRPNNEHVLVVGAGLSGLSAAVLLARQGVPVELWDGGQNPGGLLQPISFQGLALDRGSHRVHPDAHPLLLELTHEEDWQLRPRQGRLVLGARQIGYPPSLLGFLPALGPERALRMLAGLAMRPAALLRFLRWENDRIPGPDDDEGFEAFVLDRVGRAAYEGFYQPYVEKVWGESAHRLSRTIAKQRISISSPMRLLARLLLARNKPDRGFLYPRDGMAALTNRLATMTRELGVVVHQQRRFDAETLNDGSTDKFGAILYSGNLADLVPDSGLEHRGLYVINMALPPDLVDNTDTWYLPESRYWFGRVSQPCQFSNRLGRSDQTILSIEIPEGRWGSNKDFLSDPDAIVSQLAEAGILRRKAQPLELRQTFIPFVYPLYRRGWTSRWLEALDKVRKLGRVLPIGRQGLFLHCNMDHCVRISQDAVEHLLSHRSAESWIDRCPEYRDLRVRD